MRHLPLDPFIPIFSPVTVYQNCRDVTEIEKCEECVFIKKNGRNEGLVAANIGTRRLRIPRVEQCGAGPSVSL